jgi:hypothetical protein
MLKPKIHKFLYLWNSWLLLSIPNIAVHVLHADASRSGSLFINSMPMPYGEASEETSPVNSLFRIYAVRSSKKAIRTPKVALNRKEARFLKVYIKESGDNLNRIKNISRIPFEIIDTVFSEYQLPVELRYLAVVESELKSSALSRVGAKGPWQLMPETARNLGLKVTGDEDERTDYYKSTRAAALYLKDLYGQFKDWLLVVAAYNGGPAPVNRAIRKSGNRNFWVLQRYLPAESRGEVKKYIATHYYFEGQGSITTLTRAERIKYLRAVKKFQRLHPEISAYSSPNRNTGG